MRKAQEELAKQKEVIMTQDKELKVIFKNKNLRCIMPRGSRTCILTLTLLSQLLYPTHRQFKY